MPRRASARRGKLFGKLPISVIARLRKEPWQSQCFDFIRISIKSANFQPEIATICLRKSRNDKYESKFRFIGEFMGSPCRGEAWSRCGSVRTRL